MCGIAGITHARFPPDQLGSVLERMAKVLVHRGPDEYGRLALPELGSGLACRRLSIVDLESGKQPISNEDGSVHVVMNGEIYNHQELRLELEQRGHRFRTRADTEVLVHLYEDQGPEFLSGLAGMFAIALLDVPRRRLLLARDRCGMKPLYYAADKSAFFFASEIKALFAAGYPAEPDFTGIDTFLSLGYVPSPRTCFSGVQKLPAGTYVVADESGVVTRRYWHFTIEDPVVRKGDREYAEELQFLLDAAVDSHLKADVPVGLLLSGGLDSSLVAAAASRVGTRRLKTFSVVFPEAPEVDEQKFQHALVEQIGSEHHEVEFRSRDIPRLLPRATLHQDVPSLAFPSIVQYRLSELASSFVKTTLSGEGADELFSGYDWYADLPYQGLRRVVPQVLARLPAEYVTHVKWGRMLRVLAAPDDWLADAEVFRIFTRREKRAVMKSRVGTEEGDLTPLRLDPDTEASCGSRLQRHLAVGFTRTLCDGLLMVNDRISMANSLEVRMPFLDNSIVDFARRLPPDLLHRNGQGKYLLSLLNQQLPALIASREKHFLQAPVRRYFRGPLRGWARDVLLDASAEGPLNKKTIEKRFDAWLDGSDVYIRRVRALVAFQLWWNEFFGRKGSVGS